MQGSLWTPAEWEAAWQELWEVTEKRLAELDAKLVEVHQTPDKQKTPAQWMCLTGLRQKYRQVGEERMNLARAKSDRARQQRQHKTA